MLFVCTGNTCRSPMAEAIARALLKKQGRDDVKVVSAGVGAFPGSPATPEACRAVRALGYEMHDHRSRPVTAELLAEADVVYVMTQAHLERVKAIDPAVHAELLDPEGQIADPIGQGQEVYDRTAAHLEELIRARLDSVKV